MSVPREDRNSTSRANMMAGFAACLVAVHGQTSFAHFHTLELGDYTSINYPVLVSRHEQDAKGAGSQCESFPDSTLSRFDVSIDDAHGVVYIADSGAMEAMVNAVKEPKADSRTPKEQDDHQVDTE